MDLINVPQLLTQIVGFLIAFWILSSVGFKPLLKMLDERKQKIADDFEAAERARVDMERLKGEFEAKIKEIENAARGRVADAVKEGEKIQAQIVEEGRVKAKDSLDKALADIEREKDKALAEMRTTMVNSVLSATERVISQKLDDAGHRKLIEQFLSEIEGVKK